MQSLMYQFLTNILLAIWGFLAALPHHTTFPEAHYMLRVLSRMLQHLGDI